MTRGWARALDAPYRFWRDSVVYPRHAAKLLRGSSNWQDPLHEWFDTERLAMRPIRVSDAEALHAHYSDEAAMTWESQPPTISLHQTRLVVALSAGSKRLNGWAITRKGKDRAIGMLGRQDRRRGEVVEISYSLVCAEWGQGLASEAVSGLLDMIFAGIYRRVFADSDPDNAPSIALLERLGFMREAVLRAEWDTHIGVRDSLIFGLLRDEWRNRVREA